jgi:arylformamidase
MLTTHHRSRRLAWTASLSLLLFLAYWTANLLFAATPGESQKKNDAKIVPDIPYTKTIDVKNPRRQTLDLYLPSGLKTKPPLLVFVHGGFWTLPDDEFRIGPSLAEALLPSGVATALVRYRLAPANRHPSQSEDVAAAVAYLVREANKYGYDSKRIFLAGHSAGAHLAALVALDPGYLRARGLEPSSLAGVIAISGIYDLHPKPGMADEQKLATQMEFGDNPDILKAASPVTHVRPTAPPFLILTAATDFPGFLVDAKKFADALRRTGASQVDQFVLPELDHFSIVRLEPRTHQARSLILEFLMIEPLAGELGLLIEAKRRWRNPPFSTLPFWEHKEPIRSYPIDQRFVQRLLPVYEHFKYELLEWPLEQYYAIDLFSYLDSLPPEKVGHGNYLTVTNIRNEKDFWDRREIERYKPVIVIGIDDEKNLFRFGIFYRALREYSWKTGPQPPVMARPLGAFIHFLNEAPLELLRQPSHDALTIDSFHLAETDPLAPIGDVPKDIYEALTHQNGCIYCHSFRGIGSRSHHSQASNGTPHGGMALPLEEYPPDVWKAFLFNQEEVAAKIGASPNIVDENLKEALYELVIKSRTEQSNRDQ